MHTHIESFSDSLVVTLSGRLTFAENGAFRQVVEDLAGSDRLAVVVDLGTLEFMDSAGMGLLLVARDVVAARGGHVSLRAAQGQVARMLRLAKFGDFFTLDFECAQV